MRFNSRDVQQMILLISLVAMFGLFVTLFRSDFKVPQKTVTRQIDIKNKVNICLPDDPEEATETSIF